MRKSKGKRLPSYDELIAAADAIGNRCDRPPAIVGGLAMQIWGSTRLTADLDVIAYEVEPFEGEPLTFGGVRTYEGRVEVDIIVRDDKWAELYECAQDEAEEVDDVPLPVVTPEWLVAMKMVAGRPKDDLDVRFLVTLDDFDFERAAEIIEDRLGPYALDDFDAIVEEATWEKEKGR